MSLSSAVSRRSRAGAWTIRGGVGLLGCLLILLQATARVASQTLDLAPVLRAVEVRAILEAAATALADSTVAIAVVDRLGRILGVYTRRDVAASSADIAVSLARTGAFFSNDDAPLSARTVRFISGIHFPPGVANTRNAALYGIENTNRGCQLDGADTQPLTRARAISGTFSSGAGRLPLPCRPSDTRGCAIGGPVLDLNGAPNFSVGITTGKADLRDTGSPLDVPVNPGGLPLYRNGRLIGGIGVAGVSPERAEYAATIGAAGTRESSGITTGLTFPDPPLPAPGAVFIDGLRLPFFGACLDFPCVTSALREPPSGARPGSFSQGMLRVPPRDAEQAPSGYLIGPHGSNLRGELSVAEVRRIVDQAVARANVTRAMIRLPLTQTTRMVIAVSDHTGRILAAFRMPDATVFSFDVSTAKARNAYYFSTREGYEVLRQFVESSSFDRYQWEPEPPPGKGWAVTNRTLSFGGQPLFPPGIDLEKRPTPGPWFDLFVYDSLNPCTEGPGPSRGADRQYMNQSGIVWFPGSAPLYKNGELVGGVGVSGDGVEQDDYVTAAAVAGFEPPDELRVDRSVIRTGTGESVRLPYLKFPRNPERR